MDKMDKTKLSGNVNVPPTAGGKSKRRGKTLKRGGQIEKDIMIEERVAKIERDIASIRKQISDLSIRKQISDSTGIGNRLRIDDRVKREKDKLLLKKAKILKMDEMSFANQEDFANSVNIRWNNYRKTVGGEKSKKNVKRKLTLKKKL